MDLHQNFLETEQNWKLSAYTAYSALFHGTFVPLCVCFLRTIENVFLVRNVYYRNYTNETILMNTNETIENVFVVQGQVSLQATVKVHPQ